MKTKFVKTIGAVVTGLLVLGTMAYAQGGRQGIDSGRSRPIVQGKAITKAEAEKKYPPSKGGGYPMGERDPHDPPFVITSPYPPHQKFDCSKIARGGLVLDTTANKVFVSP